MDTKKPPTEEDTLLLDAVNSDRAASGKPPMTWGEVLEGRKAWESIPKAPKIEGQHRLFLDVF